MGCHRDAPGVACDLGVLCQELSRSQTADTAGEICNGHAYVKSIEPDAVIVNCRNTITSNTANVTFASFTITNWLSCPTSHEAGSMWSKGLRLSGLSGR